LFSVSHDGFLKKWSVEDNLIIESINLKKVLTKLAVSPDKSLIAVGRIDGSVVLLDKNFKIIKVFKPNNSIITQIKFSGNHTFITSSFDKRIVSVDISNGTMIELYKSNDYITNFDIREKQFIYSARNGTIKYYNKNCLTTKK
jgi:WD40 repeat protein